MGGVEVPPTDILIVATCEKNRLLRTEGHRRHLVLVACEWWPDGAGFTRVGDVPDTYRAVVGDCRHTETVRGECQRAQHPSRVTFEGRTQRT